MHSRSPFGGRPMIGGFGSGPVPRDIWVLLGVVFVTFSMQFFGATQVLVELLRLTPRVWQLGLVWQLFTYPFAGVGGASIWILLELLILFWFARDVFSMLRRRKFWELIVVGSLGAALVAVLTELGLRLLASPMVPTPFVLMNGQRMLLVITIAAFATLRRDATILLFFVLPVQAKYFLALEILFGFIAFLGYHDLAGFFGICAAVAISYSLLTRRRIGGLLREGRLRLERLWIQAKLKRIRRKSRFRVVKGGGSDSGGSSGSGDPDRWVH